METKVHNEIKPKYARDFILAGRAKFTFYSDTTQNSYKFLVNRKLGSDIWWVKFLNNKEDHQYIGYLKADIWWPTDKKIGVEGRAAQDVFDYGWRVILQDKVPHSMHILHDGICGYCSRPLTDAVSLITGIGPICRKKLGLS
jgi:hypothetical protein